MKTYFLFKKQHHHWTLTTCFVPRSPYHKRIVKGAFLSSPSTLFFLIFLFCASGLSISKTEWMGNGKCCCVACAACSVLVWIGRVLACTSMCVDQLAEDYAHSIFKRDNVFYRVSSSKHLWSEVISIISLGLPSELCNCSIDLDILQPKNSLVAKVLTSVELIAEI